jgi:hypothetical protein
MRHLKRWQDVAELLDAGINVYTTLNVQHPESVNDIVERITGVKVRETLPEGIVHEVGATLRGRDAWGVVRAAFIVGGLGATGLAYVLGKVRDLLTPDARDAGPSDATAGMGARRRPRVLVVTPRFLPEIGGAENHVALVTERLAGEFDTTVLTTDPTGLLPVEETVGRVRVLRVPAWRASRDLRVAPDITRIVREGGWDLVHVQSYHTAVAPLALRAARRAGIPYVLTFHHGGHTTWFRGLLRAPQRAILRPYLVRAEALISVSEFEAGFFSEALGLPRDRFDVIPNGCDLPAPDPADVAAQRDGCRTIVSWDGSRRPRGSTVSSPPCRPSSPRSRTPHCASSAPERMRPSCGGSRSSSACRTACASAPSRPTTGRRWRPRWPPHRCSC